MKRILIIEDEVQILRMLELFLSKQGYQVFTALGGQEGLSAVQAQPVDLVITDLRLPGLSGMEVIEGLRLEPRPPKILVMSGDEHLGKLAVDAGAAAFAEKPLDFCELDGFVSDLLRDP